MDYVRNFLDEEMGCDLWWYLVLARRAMHKVRVEELKKYDIQYAEAPVLFTVPAIGKEATPSEISRWLLLEPHTITSVLHRMEKRGLVKKVKDLDRKNMVRVLLTEKGMEYYQKLNKRDSIREIMTALTEEERKQMKKYTLKLLHKALEVGGMSTSLPYK